MSAIGLKLKSLCIECSGPSNQLYQIEVESVWDRDPEENLRVLASIDDGKILSSLFPTSVSFIVTPENQVLDY